MDDFEKLGKDLNDSWGKIGEAVKGITEQITELKKQLTPEELEEYERKMKRLLKKLK